MNKIIHFLRRVKRGVSRRLFGKHLQLKFRPVLPHVEWMKQRLIDRKTEYQNGSSEIKFSLMTPVFDPPVEFLQALSESVFNQDYSNWEWVLVENGCKDQRVLTLLHKLLEHPQVKLVRPEMPGGIIGGMRQALLHATGDYVCPVDHDDHLYPDALRVVNWYLERNDYPKLAYTDEDKLHPFDPKKLKSVRSTDLAVLPLHKPDWDPVMFLNCCYIAHLGVMNRQAALEAELYTDSRSEGTPDGDAFCRLIALGHTPFHIPEIVYSWRMHETSTALRGVEAKPYVSASQYHALSRHLERMNLSDRFTVRTNPLPGIPGTWRVTARTGNLPKLPQVAIVQRAGSKQDRLKLLHHLEQTSPIPRIHWPRYDLDSLLSTLDQYSSQDWIVLLSPLVSPVIQDWIHELMTVAGVCPNVVMTGGLVLDSKGMIKHAGGVFGWEGLLGSPLVTQHPLNLEAGYGFSVYQRSVSSVDPRFCVIRNWFLKEVVTRHQLTLSHPMLEHWLAAEARHRGLRIVYTPHAVARELTSTSSSMQPSLNELMRFVEEHGEFLLSDPYYSRFAGLTVEHTYQAVHPSVRATFLNRTLCILAGVSEKYEAWKAPGDRYHGPSSILSETDAMAQPRLRMSA